ncbi:unnamed protein product [Somion occarium]|uniref:Uncharacterized protein n=1 Tax=Somion occarium TaxID=3059160 RepID=A0ABP1DRW9_9APHY
MSKRKRVPVAVHSELTEYSALLRALRTTDTLDLTSHVIPENVLRRFHTERDSQNLNDDVDSTNVDTNILPSPSRAPSAGLQSDAMSVDVSPSSSRRPSHKEITWTRWPLLVGDVHIPEFSFEDEVRNMAKQILELKMRASLRQGLPEGHVLASEATQTNTVSDDDSPKDASPPASPSSASTTLDASESLPHHVLNPLCQATATHLSQILGSVASMVPDVHISMQDRLKPVDWQDLLGMVGECGFVDQSIIQRVRDRMLALYPEDEAYREVCTISSLVILLLGIRIDVFPRSPIETSPFYSRTGMIRKQLASQTGNGLQRRRKSAALRLRGPDIVEPTLEMAALGLMTLLRILHH